MSKYQNPISKTEMVTLPHWEYARLVADRNTFNILRLLVENDKSYDATTLLKLMIDNENKMEG